MRLYTFKSCHRGAGQRVLGQCERHQTIQGSKTCQQVLCFFIFLILKLSCGFIQHFLIREAVAPQSVCGFVTPTLILGG